MISWKIKKKKVIDVFESENMRNIFNFIRNNISYYQARPSQGSNSTPVDWRADALPFVYGHFAKGKRKK